jgi:hypothetical protein
MAEEEEGVPDENNSNILAMNRSHRGKETKRDSVI